MELVKGEYLTSVFLLDSAVSFIVVKWLVLDNLRIDSEFSLLGAAPPIVTMVVLSRLVTRTIPLIVTAPPAVTKSN